MDQLHYIKKGAGTLVVDGRSYRISPKTFYITGPEVFHEQISDMDDPMVEYGMYLQVSVTESLRRDNIMSQFLNTPFYICSAGQEPAVIMEEIFREIRKKKYGYELMLDALIEQFLITITRLYENRTVKRKKAAGAVPADMTYLTIEEAFLYDYKDLTLPELAKRVNLGIRQTQRLLNKHYNLTFSQKKDEARMSAALLLLKGTNKSVGEISEELGFSSPEHFTNSFKKYFGKTPGAYRKKVL